MLRVRGYLAAALRLDVADGVIRKNGADCVATSFAYPGVVVAGGESECEDAAGTQGREAPVAEILPEQVRVVSASDVGDQRAKVRRMRVVGRTGREVFKRPVEPIAKRGAVDA